MVHPYPHPHPRGPFHPRLEGTTILLHDPDTGIVIEDLAHPHHGEMRDTYEKQALVNISKVDMVLKSATGNVSGSADVGMITLAAIDRARIGDASNLVSFGVLDEESPLRSCAQYSMLVNCLLFPMAWQYL